MTGYPPSGADQAVILLGAPPVLRHRRKRWTGIGTEAADVHVPENAVPPEIARGLRRGSRIVGVTDVQQQFMLDGGVPGDEVQLVGSAGDPVPRFRRIEDVRPKDVDGADHRPARRRRRLLGGERRGEAETGDQQRQSETQNEPGG